jgi:hypothetical protein
MTVKAQILNTLRGGWVRTDAELANTIQRPVASVRRARLELERAGALVNAGPWGRSTQWELASVAKPTPTKKVSPCGCGG